MKGKTKDLPTKAEFDSPLLKTWPGGTFSIAMKDTKCDFKKGCNRGIKAGEPYSNPGDANPDHAGGFGYYRFCLVCAEIKEKDPPQTVPPGIIREQRQTTNVVKAANDSGTDRYVTDAMKLAADKALIVFLTDSMASVTSALKSNANALHKDRHHPMPFAMCQSEECVCNRTMIDNAIGIIAKTERLEEIDEELEDPDYEPEDDPDIRPTPEGKMR